MKSGKYQIDVLQEGRILVDGGTAFAGLPRSEWEAFASPDEKNRIPLGINFLLIRGEGMNMLVDAGIGNKNNPARLKLFGLEQLTSVGKHLTNFDLTPDDITHLVFTHLHYDHCGGATEEVGDETRAVFNKAAIYMQKDEWNAACFPDDFSRSSYNVHDFMPLFETGNIRFISGEYEIVEGISVEVTGGHTAAHQMIRIKDRERTIIYPGDICPTPFHINPRRHESFDLYPLETLQARNNLLRRAMRPDTLVIFSHSQNATFYQIEFNQGLYQAVPVDDN